MMSMTGAETRSVIFKLVHRAIAILCLIIIGLYVYEENVVTFKNYTDIYAVIPTSAEFEGDEPIGFFVFSNNEVTVDVDVRQILMCDYADGNGFGAVSSQNSSVLLTAKDKVLSDQGFNLTELSGSHLQTAQHLRALIAEGSVSDLLIYDGIPKETSQCFTKFRFSVKTPNFNIEKTVDEVSLPFDYIWYYTPVEKAYIEEDIND